jgi:hypothetical protein
MQDLLRLTILFACSAAGDWRSKQKNQIVSNRRLTKLKFWKNIKVSRDKFGERGIENLVAKLSFRCFDLWVTEEAEFLDVQ